jgi:hypothetical protein
MELVFRVTWVSLLSRLVADSASLIRPYHSIGQSFSASSQPDHRQDEGLVLPHQLLEVWDAGEHAEQNSRGMRGLCRKGYRRDCASQGDQPSLRNWLLCGPMPIKCEDR